TPKSVTLINGDTCAVGDWVVWVQSVAQGSFSRIGRVAEIVQLVGSAAQRKGAADYVFVSRTTVGDPHDVYKMLSFSLDPDWKTINDHGQDIKCTINIQHNCADNKCRTTRSRVVVNEREVTAERALAIEHLTEGDLIVNTVQMRDAAALDAFR
ncbi:hypothetical protein B0H13DRAFT_1560248, partial [Mycena leptocephala]